MVDECWALTDIEKGVGLANQKAPKDHPNSKDSPHGKSIFTLPNLDSTLGITAIFVDGIIHAVSNNHSESEHTFITGHCKSPFRTFRNSMRAQMRLPAHVSFPDEQWRPP